MLKPYSELVKIDVLPFCDYREAKDDNGRPIKVPYLNWAKCKELLHENGAEAVYFEPLYNEKGSSLFMSDVQFIDKYDKTNRCYEVRVKVVVDDNEWIMNAPLLNGTNVVRDDTMNQLRLSNAQARAFVKCVAIHTGLGFNLWVKNDEEAIGKEEDLSIHSLTAIQKRIEQLITSKLAKGIDFKDLCAAAGLKVSDVEKIPKFLTFIDRAEKAIEKV